MIELSYARRFPSSQFTNTLPYQSFGEYDLGNEAYLAWVQDNSGQFSFSYDGKSELTEGSYPMDIALISGVKDIPTDKSAFTSTTVVEIL